MTKLYFYKCTHFLLFVSLSTFFVHCFHSYTKTLTLIPHIPSPNSTYSHPDSPYSHPYFQHSDPDSPHSDPDSPYSQPDSPHSVLRFPVLAFTYSQIFDIINILFDLLFFCLILEPFLRENVSIPTDASFCSLKAI